MPAWKPGETGNPNGRPKKYRAWTKILEAAGDKTVDTPSGKIARKRLMADLLMQGITTGEVVFPNETKFELSARDWLDLVWRAYGQVDGPPKAELDVTTDGQPINQPTVYLPEVTEGDGG